MNENLTKQDLEDQKEFIISSILTITAQITENVKSDNSRVHYETTKRILELEDNVRNTQKEFGSRIEDIETYLANINEFEKTYIKFKKHAYKIFLIIIFVMLIISLIYNTIFHEKPN